MAAIDTVKRYFEAMGAQDLDGALALWEPGGVERIVGGPDLIAPDAIREYFGELFAAFPDFKFEVLETAADGDRVAVRWRARGTFAGPGRFQGLEPNGAKAEIEGCDLIRVSDGRITHNDAYLDSGDVARQLGFLPAVGSSAEATLAKVANVGTKVRARMRASEPERVADDVWLLRGGFPARTMNVYLIEDDGGVTVFDAGIEDMTRSILIAAVRMGGIKRVVLGHADADHRGAAPGLDAPVFCHPDEREAAESPDHFRTYWNYDLLEPPGGWVIPRLVPVWDGGAVQIAGTVKEGDEVAGFEVVEFPGHAPGQIGLFRERDRLALVSDCFYTLDLRTMMKAPARVPHPSANLSTEQAADSIRKLAGLRPSAAWAGHADPVTGDVVSQLHRAAETL
jgi:glyoxylase-like metal-dependent hydrolase (beta-lactamase superfamily II)/predicted ester cyclase